MGHCVTYTPKWFYEHLLKAIFNRKRNLDTSEMSNKKSYFSVAMQDLSDWDLLGHHLQNMGPDLTVASEMGCILAKMHQRTSKSNVTPEYWEELSKFRYIHSLSITILTFNSISILYRPVICNILTKTNIFL